MGGLLDLENLYTLIKQREVQNLRVINNIAQRKVYYPFGYTGAGKTTFILWACGISLTSSNGKYQAEEELPAELAHLQIGQFSTSCTVYVSATVYQNLVFLDGPGFEDSHGLEMDISNVVAMAHIFKNIPRLAPILFIDYLLFDVVRGSRIRKLVQGFCTMFSDNTALLEEHMIVVWTKVPEDVTLDTIGVRVKELSNAESVDNTPQVMDILLAIAAGIENTKLRRTTKAMCNRVIIFRPTDEKGSRNIQSILRNAPQIDNPGDYFVANLSGEAKSALDNSLTHMRTEVPILLQNGEMEKLSKLLLLLSQLSSTIPSVNATLHSCTKALYASLVDQLVDAKQHLESQLAEGVPVNPIFIKKFIETRKLLASIDELRTFMDPLEPLDVFDSWTLQKFDQLVMATMQFKDFVSIGVNLKKLCNLTDSFSYLAGLKPLVLQLVQWVEKQVYAIQRNIVELQLQAEQVNNIATYLRELEQASEQVQVHISINCRKVIRDAVTNVNTTLRLIFQGLVNMLQSPPSSMEKKFVDDLQTLKAVANCKDLLPYVGLEHNQEEGQSPEVVGLYKKIVQQSIESVKRVIDQLKLVAQSSSALDSSSERFIHVVKAIGELDTSVKQFSDLELDRAILYFNNAVDSIIDNLKRILYNPEGPSYREVPLLMRQLDSCAWLDKHSFTGNRITQKKAEVVECLNSSLKTMTDKLNFAFAKDDYEGTQRLYQALEGDMSVLEGSLPTYSEVRTATLKSLKEDIEKMFSKIECHMGGSGASEYSLPDGDGDLGHLAKLAGLSKAIGLDSRHTIVTRKLKTYLHNKCNSLVLTIVSDNEYKFEVYRDILDCLAAVRSKEEYSNLDDSMRLYDKARDMCCLKVNQIKSLLTENNPETSVLLGKLGNAVVLNFHLLPQVDVMQIINDTKALKVKVLQDKAKEIEGLCRSYAFVDAKDLLDSFTDAEKLRSLRFLVTFFSDMTKQLFSSITFYTVFNTDNTAENRRSFQHLHNEISKFEEASRIFGETLGKQHAFNFTQSLDRMYALFDDKLRSELDTIAKRAKEVGFQKAEERMEYIRLLSSTLDPYAQRLHAVSKAISEMRVEFSTRVQTAYAQLDNFDENIEKIDNMCAQLAKQNHPEAEFYINSVVSCVWKMTEKASSSSTLAEAKSVLQRLDKLYLRTFFEKLKAVVNQARLELRSSIEGQYKKKEEDFGRHLVEWDLTHIRKFFQDCSQDADVINLLNIKLRDAVLTLVARNEETLRNMNIEGFKRNFSIISTVTRDFPLIIDAKYVQEQVNVIQRFALQQIKWLIEKLANGNLLMLKDSSIVAALTAVIELKTLDDANGNIIPEQQFAELIAHIVSIFGENTSNLEKSIARRDFRLMAETLEWVKQSESWQRSIRSLLEKSSHKSMAPLLTTLNNCPDAAQSRKHVEKLLNTLEECIEAEWQRKEFSGIVKLIQVVQSGSAKQLAHLFPKIEEILNGAVATITEKYQELCRNAETSFDLEKWKEFRECLATLESATNVEIALGMQVQMQIKSKIVNKINMIREATAGTREETANSLVELNKISQNIPQYTDIIKQTSNTLITAYAGGSGDKMYELGLVLDNMDGPHGKDVVSSFKAFSVVNMQAWAKKTSGQGIDWATGDAENGEPRFVCSDSFEDPSKSAHMWTWSHIVAYCKSKVYTDEIAHWRLWFKKFDDEFRSLYDKSLLNGLAEIVQDTYDLIRWSKPLPSILAHICIIWSRLKTGSSATAQQQTFRLAPHPVQVLCLFRLCKSSTKQRGAFYNQLIEILTGEGKSVVLGIAATYFALSGFDVFSICYSEYLCTRDFKDFEEVFEAFKVKDKIIYSTISNMCEIIINQKGNVRDLAKKVIESASQSSSASASKPAPSKSVLLIDEVDVFFGKDFYGNTYNPATLISNQETYEILNFIYTNRNKVDMNAVSATKFYLDLMKIYPKLKLLIDHEIRKMLKEVVDFENTPERPIVNNGTIYYKDQDVITCKKVYGYKTAFQYFHKFTLGEISDVQSVKVHVGVYLGCGNFSFAEIPKDFTYKMGVSGTLRSLTKEEIDIVRSYGIQRLAFAPSIYGGSRLNESETRPKVSSILLQQTKDMWFLRIANVSQEKQRVGRAVLVFFENIDVLNEFVADKGKELRNYQILEEKEKFKEAVVKQATESGALTLCTRSFGRGVDFICRDPRTEASGGVHVIQCFVASSEAEQIQIKGRTARQGQPGSHEYLLFYGDLVKHLGTVDGQPEESGFKNFDADSKLTFDELNQKITRLRDELYRTEVKELSTKKNDALKAHDATKRFHENLISYDGTQKKRDEVTDSFLRINQAALSQAASKYHLFFCLDESGSMSGKPWKHLMKAVSAFINKRIEMCNANNCPAEDLVTVVNYADAGRIVVKNKLITAKPQASINFISGGTDFAAGLNTVLTCIKTTAAGFAPVLIFMSDGDSSTGEEEMENLHAECPSTKVFVIGFGSGCDRAKLGTLAQKGGGQFFFGADGTQLLHEFEVISTNLSGGIMAL